GHKDWEAIVEHRAQQLIIGLEPKGLKLRQQHDQRNGTRDQVCQKYISQPILPIPEKIRLILRVKLQQPRQKKNKKKADTHKDDNVNELKHAVSGRAVFRTQLSKWHNSQSIDSERDAH